MASTSAPPTVAELVDAFAGAPSAELDAEFHRLAGALWNDGAATDLALPATTEIVNRFGSVDGEHQGHLAILLGMLVETELPATDGPIATAAAAGVDDWVSRWRGTTKGEPLSLALQYLLAHFPADRDRILEVGTALGLAVDDFSRLDRGLSRLDPDNPAIGYTYPSPASWDLDEAEQELNRKMISGLSPEQVRESWDKDTRTVLGNAGAKAYWAVRFGPVPDVRPDTEAPSRHPDPQDADVAIFQRHAESIRCPNCGGTFEFRPGTARCTDCSTAYPIARGMLDLSRAMGQDYDGDAFLFDLAKMGAMGYFYEAAARPNFTRLCGFMWGDAPTAESEFEWIKSHVSPVDGPVLDIAAGAGTWTKEIVDEFGADRVIALDLLPGMLATLRERLPETPAIIKDASTLPFGDASLGAVICWNGPQAFIDVAPAVIAEVGRCLKPGGTFTTYTFGNSDDPIYRYFVGSHHLPHPAGGLRVFELDELKGWLADAGLKITEETRHRQAIFVRAEKTS
jgi:ubiquinone/menaquinone biosynthesis C-methylase UbiE